MNRTAHVKTVAGALLVLLLYAPVAADEADAAKQRSLEAYGKHQYTQADSIITTFLDRHPQDADANYLASLCKYQLKDYAASVRFARRAVEISPNFKNARSQFESSLIARIYEMVAEPLELDRAVQEAQAGVDFSNTSGTQYALGVACYERWRLGDDTRDLNQAMTAWKVSQEQSLQNHEQAATPLLLQGIDAFSQGGREAGKYREALELFNRASALLAHQGHDDLPYCALWRGLTEYQLKDYPAAEKDFQAALHLFGAKNPSLHRYLGDLYLTQGEYDKSAHEYENALRLKSDYFPARLGLARVYVQRKETGLAAATYASLLEAHPNGAALSEVADFYNRQGMVDQAIATYTAAADKLATEQQEAETDLRHHVWVSLGLLRAMRGTADDIQQGSRLAAVLQQGDPDNAVAALLQGLAALRQGDAAAARAGCTQALTYEGPMQSDLLSLALGSLGDVRLATASLSTPEHLTPDRVLAMLYYRKACQYAAPGSAWAQTLQQKFAATRQAELDALQRYLHDQLPLLSIAAGHASTARFEQDLSARQAAVSGLTLPAAGDARREDHVGITYVGGTPDELVDPYVVVARQDTGGALVSGNQDMSITNLKNVIGATTR